MICRKKFYPLILFFVALIFSCSKYTIDDDGNTSDNEEAVNIYLKFRKDQSGNVLDIEYPVHIFCVDKTSSAIQDFYFEEGSEILVSVNKSEYSVNAFLGVSQDNFIIMNDINGKPMVTINEYGVSHKPVMSAHSTLNIDKQTEINFIPSYIVSSAEFEFSNIPSDVKSVEVEISPVCCGYHVEGGLSDRTQTARIECEPVNGEWISGQKFIFPAEGKKTSVTVILNYENDVKTFQYTFSEGLKQGQPYKFTGGYDDDLSLNGDFEISGWNIEEEIFIDFENGTPVADDNENNNNEDDNEPDGEDSSVGNEDIFYVDELPSAKSVWGSFYMWKVEKTGSDEALATIISPDQWFQIYEEGEAMKILNDYKIDDISGWRTFTREEAEEFFKDFSTSLDELNPYLEENGHNIFYTENRYLCENGEYAFNMYGETNIRAAGKTVKYYLRPVRTLRLKVRS